MIWTRIEKHSVIRLNWFCCEGCLKKFVMTNDLEFWQLITYTGRTAKKYPWEIFPKILDTRKQHLFIFDLPGMLLTLKCGNAASQGVATSSTTE